MSLSQNEYYKDIADKLIEQLKAGTAPWQRPWTGGQSIMPHNPVSGTRYKGGNTIALMAKAIDKGFEDSRWMTYEQAKSVGAQVRKGEKGTLLRFYKFTDDRPVLDSSGQPLLDGDGKKIMQKVQLDAPKVCSFVVFNASQVDGLLAAEPVRERSDWEISSRAEMLLKASGAKISYGGNRAYYSYQTDEIRLPPRETFLSDTGFYATAVHEVGHWSGHSSRLDRDMRHPFGSVGYAKEELRAEIFSMMLGDEVGLGHDPGQHAAYVGSWIKVLQEDHREIFRAAADSEKMMGYVMELEREHVLERENERTSEMCIVVNRTTSTENGELLNETLGSRIGLRPDLEATIEHEWTWSDRDDDPEGEFSRDVVEKIADLSVDLRNQFFKKLENPSYVKAWEPKDLETVKGILSKGVSNGQQHSPEQSSLNVESIVKTNSNIPFVENETANEKTYLLVPYLERNNAKKLGAKWDAERKSWYAQPNDDLKKFEKWLDKKTAVSPRLDPVEEFSIALKEAGLVLDGAPVMDGQLHRVPVVDGDRRSRDGAYTGHMDGRPAGYIENFKTGYRENWKSQGYSLSDAEKARLHAEAAHTLEVREKERERGYEQVAEKADYFVKGLEKANWDHPYIFGKHLNAAHGALLHPSESTIVLPASDIDGKVWSYQSISDDGKKSFAPGGKISGCLFVATPSILSGIVNATPKQFIENALKTERIYIAEGFATASSLSESLNTPVFVAFSAGNLESVAKAIESKAPKAEIVICGDDDRGTEIKRGNNPGREKAMAAVTSVNGRAVFPVFPPGEKTGTDFNDLHKTIGADAVRHQVLMSLYQLKSPERLQKKVALAKVTNLQSREVNL